MNARLNLVDFTPGLSDQAWLEAGLVKSHLWITIVVANLEGFVVSK